MVFAAFLTVYVIYGCFMAWMHRAVIYNFFPEDYPLPPLERVDLSEIGASRVSVFDGNETVVLFLMGNGGSLAHHVPWLEFYVQSGYTLVAMEYPGGAGLPGKPTEAVLKDQSLKVFDWVADQYPGQPIIVHGYSMGSGLAIHVAARRHIAGLVLEAPFGAMCRLMARATFLPACLIPFVDHWKSEVDVPNIKVPVLMLHGEIDRVVPLFEGQRLRQAFPDTQVQHVGFPEGNHVNLPDFEEYGEVIDAFIAQLPKE